MPEERREVNTKLVSFMATAETKLENIHVDIIELNKKVAIQNGRVTELEKIKTLDEGRRLFIKQVGIVCGGIISFVTLIVLTFQAFKTH